MQSSCSVECILRQLPLRLQVSGLLESDGHGRQEIPGQRPPRPEGSGVSVQVQEAVAQLNLVQIPLNIPLPSTRNLATNWKKFHRAWNNQEKAAPLKDPESPAMNKSLRTATLLTCIGSDSLDVCEGSEFDNEDGKQDIDIVLQKLQRYCIGVNRNLREIPIQQERPRAKRISGCYVTALRTLGKTCNFGVLENSVIRDRIVIGVRDNQTRKKLVQASKLTLREYTGICRSCETSSQQLNGIYREEVSVIIHTNEKKPREMRCKFCAKTHIWNLSVLHGERPVLIVEFKSTLRWPAKPNRLHPVRPGSTCSGGFGP